MQLCKCQPFRLKEGALEGPRGDAGRRRGWQGRSPCVRTWHAPLHGGTASLDTGWLFLKARLVAAQASRARQPRGWAGKHRWEPRRPRGSCRAGPPAPGRAPRTGLGPPHRAGPTYLQLFIPNPTAPHLAERRPEGKWTPRAGPVPSSAHLLGEASWMPTCPLHLLLLPAPMPTPSPDPSAPSGALPEPLVTTFLWHHQHGRKSSQGTLMKVSAVFPPHHGRRDG